MTVQGRGLDAAASFAGWDRPQAAVVPLRGQVGLFEYRPHAVEHGHGELSIPDAISGRRRAVQWILWDVET
jgi:hypothetical protein